MRFSLIYEAQMADPSPANERQVFADIVEQSLLAEELGFDVVWAVEHTALTHYAHMSAPETFLAYLAGRTTRIGLGHGVVCLPPQMNHPGKVAERIATLDILSGGRVHFGMGKGATQQEAGTFGYELEALPPMIDEAITVRVKPWVTRRLINTGITIRAPTSSRPTTRIETVIVAPVRTARPRFNRCTRTPLIFARSASNVTWASSELNNTINRAITTARIAIHQRSVVETVRTLPNRYENSVLLNPSAMLIRTPAPASAPYRKTASAASPGRSLRIRSSSMDTAAPVVVTRATAGANVFVRRATATPARAT